jgi:DNA topoisomerase-1
MAKNLVIVESPAKAKTLEKFLGKDFKVLASYGHVRDIPSKKGMVDVEADFAPQYSLIPENKKHVDAIKKELKGAGALYLATDPDREGEAISWHLLAALGLDKAKKAALPVHRVAFHEVTKGAVLDAVAHPRTISMELVDAQQARRVLDYLVGFTLSPFLWKKIRYGLSAGRVQSVALRLVCEREREIRAFQAQEYWTVGAELASHEGKAFTANLVEVGGKKLDKFGIPDKAAADAILAALEAHRAAGGAWTVAEVTRSQRKRSPAPPFTTSTLQQEASRKLGFSAKKTMTVAQRLYEGIDVGEGAVGLITYMRTDSVALAQQALAEAREVIAATFGPEYALEKPRTYKNRAKNAQEAHEAVRPTTIARTPASVRTHLTPDQLKLYELIWKRTVASQMPDAQLDQTAVEIDAAPGHRFRATGSVVRFPGFIRLYTEGTDDSGEEKEGILPALEQGEALALRGLLPEQHFTEPPPRYSEATLVKTLEEYGIGRPSTYAAIMNTLVTRKYVRLEKRRFFPEDVGMVVNDLLVSHFTKYVDYNFTAELEEELDRVSRGEKQWKPLLREFWGPFSDLLRQKEGEVSKSDVTTEATKETCPDCGRPLVVKLGRRGKFLSCSGFPECRYMASLAKDGQTAEEPVVSDQTCEKCGKPMVVKLGRYGRFLSCSGYPECKNMQPLVKPRATGVACPQCGTGELTERRSRFGPFFSCNRYPECKYAVKDEPVAKACPTCSFPVVVKKLSKRTGPYLRCARKECDWRENLPADAEGDAGQGQ